MPARASLAPESAGAAAACLGSARSISGRSGALEHSYAPVVLLRNTQENAKSACVSFDTNKNPIGVKVFAEVNGTKLVREIRSVNGAVQSEPMAVFGLGKAEQADNVEVHWPDGTIDQLGSISSCYK